MFCPLGHIFNGISELVMPFFVDTIVEWKYWPHKRSGRWCGVNYVNS